MSDIMSTVRGFYRHQVRRGAVPDSVNRLLYDVVEPAGESMPWLEDLPAMVARPLHRLPRSGVSEPRAASLDEYLAMLAVAGSVRDKLLITVLALTGVRIGQALGLRRSDMHLMANSRAVGCSYPGPHVHVVRREDNENLALSKRRRELVVPAHPWLVGVYAAYGVERDRVPAACLSDSCSSTWVVVSSVGRCATVARGRSLGRSGAGRGSSRWSRRTSSVTGSGPSSWSRAGRWTRSRCSSATPRSRPRGGTRRRRAFGCARRSRA